MATAVTSAVHSIVVTTDQYITVKALYIAGIIFRIFPVNIISLGFNLADFEFLAYIL